MSCISKLTYTNLASIANNNTKENSSKALALLAARVTQVAAIGICFFSAVATISCTKGLLLASALFTPFYLLPICTNLIGTIIAHDLAKTSANAARIFSSRSSDWTAETFAGAIGEGTICNLPATLLWVNSSMESLDLSYLKERFSAYLGSQAHRLKEMVARIG